MSIAGLPCMTLNVAHEWCDVGAACQSYISLMCFNTRVSVKLCCVLPACIYLAELHRLALLI
eukprot:8366611-Prorocentrum_lima.AAC.1